MSSDHIATLRFFRDLASTHAEGAALDAAIAALSRQRAVPEGVLVWVRNKRTLLSARMSAGEFHAQEALDMAMLSRLEVFLAAPSPEQEK